MPEAGREQPTAGDAEQRGKRLIDQMIEALGGQSWLDRHTMEVEGRTAAFFRGAPTGMVVQYKGYRRFVGSGQPPAERIGFLSDKSMILPGKKIDVVQIFTEGTAYEVTYKGRTTLPKEIVTDYYRRQKHSIESVAAEWIKVPGVMILDEGPGMVERKLSERVTVLSPDNDAVTIELDATSHLPLRRTFKWRNEQFKDFDEDAETYDDYHTVDGLPTAYTLTRYRNGDMTNQRFYTKVAYNMELPPDLFTQEKLDPKKK